MKVVSVFILRLDVLVYIWRMSVMYEKNNGVARPDITVYKDHKPLLVLEVKFRKSVSADWAARYRRNLLTHSIIPKTPYFMLVLSEKTFLWGPDPSEAITERLPDYEFSTPELFSRYIDADGARVALHEASLELMSRFWLDHVSSQPSESGPTDVPAQVLASGLYKALHEGTVAVS